MDRYEPLCPLVYEKLKSKRRKKRLQKAAFDKKLLSIYREERKLYKEAWLQELILLEKPILRGWKRYFVMRDDLQNRPDAPFFQSLLEKINTVEYSRNKKFRIHKRRVKKYRYVLQTQRLRYITEHNYHHPRKCLLNEKEKRYFIPEYGYGNKTLYIKHYVFNQPWRYELTVKPNWITHAKELDEIREQKLGEINRYITTNHLRHKMAKLKDGKASYKGYFVKTSQYEDTLKNKPFTHYLEMYEDEKEFTARKDQTNIEI